MVFCCVCLSPWVCHSPVHSPRLLLAVVYDVQLTRMQVALGLLRMGCFCFSNLKSSILLPVSVMRSASLGRVLPALAGFHRFHEAITVGDVLLWFGFLFPWWLVMWVLHIYWPFAHLLWKVISGSVSWVLGSKLYATTPSFLCMWVSEFVCACVCHVCVSVCKCIFPCVLVFSCISVCIPHVQCTRRSETALDLVELEL